MELRQNPKIIRNLFMFIALALVLMLPAVSAVNSISANLTSPTDNSIVNNGTINLTVNLSYAYVPGLTNFTDRNLSLKISRDNVNELICPQCLDNDGTWQDLVTDSFCTAQSINFSNFSFNDFALTCPRTDGLFVLRIKMGLPGTQAVTKFYGLVNTSFLPNLTLNSYLCKNHTSGQLNITNCDYAVDNNLDTYAGIQDGGQGYITFIYLNYTYNDYITSSKVYVYNSTNNLVNNTTYTFTNGTTNSFLGIVVNLIDGAYKWFYEVTDTKGETNITSNWTFNVLLSYTTPTEVNDSNKSQNWIYINITVNESNEANITFRLYNNAFTLINNTTYIDNRTYENFTGLDDGIYYYNVTVTNLLNYQNTTETRKIILDKSTPWVILNNLINTSIPLFKFININFTYNVSDLKGPCSALGGAITMDGDYCVHTFINNGTFNATSNLNASILVVAGGGGGTSISGGGGGGVIYNSSFPLISNTQYNVIVGSGGIGTKEALSQNGANSSFGDVMIGVGGGAGSWSTNGFDGGSGGGGSPYTYVGGNSTQGNYSGIGYGNKGGDFGTTGYLATTGAGGGGAGGVGHNLTTDGGVGGEALTFNISGINVDYGGGGGGGGTNAAGGTNNSSGGKGGDIFNTYPATNGVANTGGGGGGGGIGTNYWLGGNGSSGIVIVRYPKINITNGSGIKNTTIYIYNATDGNSLINQTTQSYNLLDIFNNTVIGIPLLLTTGAYNWFADIFDFADNYNYAANQTLNISIDPREPWNSSSTNTNEWKMYGRDLNNSNWDGITYSTISGFNKANYSVGADVTKITVAKGYVYASSVNGNLYQFNASNVSQLLNTFVSGAASIYTLPIVAGDYVYVGDYNSPYKLHQLNATNISQEIAFYTTSGNCQWNGVVYNDSYFKTCGSTLYQLNASNISKYINNFTGVQNLFNIAIAGNNVYVNGWLQGLYQLNLSNISQVISSISIGGGWWSYSAPSVYKDYVYIGTVDPWNRIYQLDATNVSQIIINAPAPGQGVYALPVFKDDFIYYITIIGGVLYQANISNISQIYQSASITGNAYDLIKQGDSIFTSGNGVLFQINASNISQTLHQVSITSGNPISVSDKYLYYGSSGVDDKLYMFNVNDISLENSNGQIILNITYPLSINYSTAITQLNFTIDGFPTACYYNINGTNVSINCSQNISGLTANQGYNTWLMYVTDGTAVNNSSITFYVDNIIPSINLTNLSSIINQSNIIFEYNVSDKNGSYGNGSGIKNTTFYLYNNTNGSLVNSTTNSSLINIFSSVISIPLILTDGIYNWFADVYDNLNNYNNTVNQTFTVNTIYPNQGVNSTGMQSNTSNISSNFIYVNITVAGNYSNVTYRLYNITNNSLINETITNETNFNFSNLNNGHYTYYWIVTGENYYQNYSENYTLTLDTQSPVLSQDYPPNLTQIFYVNTSNVTFNFTANDSTSGLYNITLYVYTRPINVSVYNLTLNYSELSLNNNAITKYLTLSDGNYYWKLDAYDFTNNYIDPEGNFTVDTSVPEINYTSPTEANDSNVSQNWIYVNVTVNESNEANITFRLYNSAFTLINSTTYTDNRTYQNFTNLSNSIYYYNVIIVDLADNQNTTETRKIVLDTLAPSINQTSPANLNYSTNGTINFTWNVSDNFKKRFCYQESANESNQSGIDGFCNLNYSGNYTVDSLVGWSGGPENCYDGDWNTGCQYFSDGRNIYPLYIKPNSDISGAIVQSRLIATGTVVNTTLPQACLDYNSEYIQLHINLNGGGGIQTSINCVSGAGDIYLDGYTGNGLYEEAIWWVFNEDSGIKNTTLYVYNNSSGALINNTTKTSTDLTSIFNSIVGIPMILSSGFYSWFANAFDFAGNYNATVNQTFVIDTEIPQVSFTDANATNVTYNNSNVSRNWIGTNLSVNAISGFNTSFTLYNASSDNTLWNNLQAYYTFDETSGTNFTDNITANNLTLGNEHQPAGKINGAYGPTTATYSANTTIDTGGEMSEMTINFWAQKPSGLGLDYLMCNYLTGAEPGSICIVGGAGTYAFYAVQSNGGLVNTPYISSPTNWTMITLIVNNTTLARYVNGVYVDSVAVTGFPVRNQAMWLFSTFDGSSKISNWEMDELGIWNRTLSPSEISRLFNDGAGFSYSNAIYNQSNYTDNRTYMNWTSLPNGHYAYEANVTSFGGTNSTGLSYITLDTLAPSINQTSPANLNYSTSGTINFTWNVSDINGSFNGTGIKNTSVYVYSGSEKPLCYQESANTSNQTGIDGNCGLNYTGTYYLDVYGVWGGPVSNFVDGNWSSLFNIDPDGSAYSYLYFNYTKPPQAISSIWKVAIGSSDNDSGTHINFSINDSNCFNSYVDKVALRLYPFSGWIAGSGPARFNASCYNGTDWINLGSASPVAPYYGYLYEEGMYWNVSQFIFVNNTTKTSSDLSDIFNAIIGIPILLSDGIYNWFVDAWDFADNRNYTSNRTLTVDSGFPSYIYFTAPTKSNGTYENNNWIAVNVSADTSNISNVTYYLYNDTLQVYKTGLQSYYKFDTNLSNITLDSIGNNNLQIVNNPPLLSGKINESFNYSESQLQYLFNSSANLSNITNIYSISMWLYGYGGSSYGAPLFYGNNFTSGYFGFKKVSPNNSLQFEFWNGTVFGLLMTTSDLNTEQWNHIVVSTNGTRIWLYVNGILNNSVDNTVANLPPIANLTISQDYRKGVDIQLYWNGKIDEMGIWNRTLSSTEVIELYNSDKGNSYNNTLLISSINSSLNNFTELSDGIYNYNATAFRLNGLTNSTETRQIILDTIYPQINYSSGIEPNNTINHNRTWIYINVTVNEINQDTINFTLYKAGTLYTFYNNTSLLYYGLDSYNHNFTNLPDGNYTYNVTLVDQVANTNSTPNMLIILDQHNPNATVVSPSNNTNTSNTSINFTISANDSAGLSNATLYIYNNTGLYNNTTISFNPIGTLSQTLGVVVTMVESVYRWFFQVFDISGLSNNTTNMTITVVTTYPNVTARFPISGTNYTNATIISAFNYTVRGVGLTECWYSINGGANSSNMAYGTNFTGLTAIDETSNTYTVYCNNTAGLVGRNSTTFNLDTSIPVISVDAPSPAVDYAIVNGYIDLDFTITDGHLDKCWFYYNGTNNTSLSCSSGVSKQVSLSLNGTQVNMTNNELVIYANDTHGNFANQTVNWYYKIFENARYYNNSTYETAQEDYVIDINSTGNATVTADMIFNGTTYTGNKSTLSNDRMNFTATRLQPSGVGNKSFYWKFKYQNISTEYVYANTSYQYVNLTLLFGPCNATSTTKYVNFTFKDEISLTYINATANQIVWSYWLANSTVNKSLTYTNSTKNYNYSFCFIPNNRTVFSDINFYYEHVSEGGSNPSYPQRQYLNHSLTMNNSTTNLTLYLLNVNDGKWVQILTADIGGIAVSDVDVQVYKNIEGANTLVGSGLTDASGSILFFLSSASPHTFYISKAGCTNQTVIITPTSSAPYTITLSCAQNLPTAPANSSLEGIRYFRSPIPGVIQRCGNSVSTIGNQTFIYYVDSEFRNITKARFALAYSNRTIIALNESYIGTDYCNTSSCYLSLLYNVKVGDDIKGAYWVDTGGGYILLESDARWRCIQSNVSDTETISTFFSRLKDTLGSWHSINESGLSCESYVDNYTSCLQVGCYWANDTSTCYDFNVKNRQEYSRIVFIFLTLAIVLAIFGRTTGYDAQNPGIFLIILTAVIAFGSFANGFGGQGYFYYSDLTPWPLLNNFFLLITTGFVSMGYWASVTRRNS